MPVRAAVEVFWATLYDTVPGPEPDAPAVTVSHAAPLAAVHAQPVAALTLTLPLAAADPTDALTADSVGGAQVGVKEN